MITLEKHMNSLANEQLTFTSDIPTGSVAWQSPSNIALVKYWGKKDIQIPCNPSVSFTLSTSNTETRLEFEPNQDNKISIEFYLDNLRNEKFEVKIVSFLESLLPVFPFIKQLKFKAYSKNTFPHSAGIASSASGMSALALCLCEIERKYFNTIDNEPFYQKASHIARLGSGSACRSLYGGVVSWGVVPGFENTSNEYGTCLNNEVHPDFLTFKDSILIVDAAQKKVSSRVGHGLMNTNPFSERRFEQANTNIVKLMAAMKENDVETFIAITESEALTLHAMMMTSMPYFLLMKPNTITLIEKIWDYRQQTGHPICFTLDAGPNIHLLYPQRIENEVNKFIQDELTKNLHDSCYLQDCVGSGPKLV